MSNISAHAVLVGLFVATMAAMGAGVLLSLGWVLGLL